MRDKCTNGDAERHFRRSVRRALRNCHLVKCPELIYDNVSFPVFYTIHYATSNPIRCIALARVSVGASKSLAMSIVACLVVTVSMSIASSRPACFIRACSIKLRTNRPFPKSGSRLTDDSIGISLSRTLSSSVNDWSSTINSSIRYSSSGL